MANIITFIPSGIAGFLLYFSEVDADIIFKAMAGFGFVTLITLGGRGVSTLLTGVMKLLDKLF